MLSLRELSRISLLLIATTILAGCPDKSTTDDDDDDDPPATGDGHVTINFHGEAGTEQQLAVNYVISDNQISRATAATTLPKNECSSGTGFECRITVPVGKYLNIFPQDGPHGGVRSDLGIGTNPVPPGPLQNEFISYSGDCNGLPGVLDPCALHVTQAKDYTVTLNYAPLKTALVQTIGAVALSYSFTARDRRYLPPQPYTGTNPSGTTGALSSTTAPKIGIILPIASTVTVTASHHTQSSLFIRWEGPCVNGTGGTSLTCKIEVGSNPGPTIRAVGEYFDCVAPSPVGISSGPAVLGDPIPAGCTRIRP